MKSRKKNRAIAQIWIWIWIAMAVDCEFPLMVNQWWLEGTWDCFFQSARFLSEPHDRQVRIIERPNDIGIVKMLPSLLWRL